MSENNVPLPHDPPLEVADDLFVVYGCVKPNPGVRFSRNMTIVRDGDELTLINPVLMSEENLQKLDALGEVKHVLRLGPMHGMDDEFYVQRYNAAFWAFADGVTYTKPDIDHPLSEQGGLPFGRAKFFVFKHLKETEGAILLERSNNILLTCDAIQSYATPPYHLHTNLFTSLMMPFIGFGKRTLIGPVWVKLLAEDKDSIKGEFQRLVEWDFDQLLAAHGTFLPNNAKAEVQVAIDKMFG